MSAEENKQVLRGWIETVINGHDPTAVGRFFSPDIVSYQPGGRAVGGAEEWQALVAEYLTAFADYRTKIETIIAEGDIVAVRWNAPPAPRAASSAASPPPARRSPSRGWSSTGSRRAWWSRPGVSSTGTASSTTLER